jgi:uncharacterized protein (TIGR03000 family)
MYGIVLMAALSGNADGRVQEASTNSMYHLTQEYRFRRGHGCCGGGCYGGGCCGGCYGGCWGGTVSPAYGCCGGRAYSGYAVPAPGVYRSYYGPPIYPAATPAAPAPLPSDRAGDFNGEQPRVNQSRTAPASALNGQFQEVDPARALLVVHVPENAKVFIGGRPTQSTGETRTYVSPPLPTNGEYRYTVRAELVREGRTIATGKEVTVRAGQPSQVTLDMSAFAPEPKP